MFIFSGRDGGIATLDTLNNNNCLIDLTVAVYYVV